jgi:hypothetical protein
MSNRDGRAYRLEIDRQPAEYKGEQQAARSRKPDKYWSHVPGLSAGRLVWF